MAICDNCGSGKLTEQPCPKCGHWDNMPDKEVAMLAHGIVDVIFGKTTPLDEIRAKLKSRRKATKKLAKQKTTKQGT